MILPFDVRPRMGSHICRKKFVLETYDPVRGRTTRAETKKAPPDNYRDGTPFFIQIIIFLSRHYLFSLSVKINYNGRSNADGRIRTDDDSDQQRKGE